MKYILKNTKRFVTKTVAKGQLAVSYTRPWSFSEDWHRTKLNAKIRRK